MAGALLTELVAAGREIVLPTANTPGDCARDVSRSVTAADSAPGRVARCTTGEFALAIGVLLTAATLGVPADTGRPSALASVRSGERRHTNELPSASPDAVARRCNCSVSSCLTVPCCTRSYLRCTGVRSSTPGMARRCTSRAVNESSCWSLMTQKNPPARPTPAANSAAISCEIPPSRGRLRP